MRMMRDQAFCVKWVICSQIDCVNFFSMLKKTSVAYFFEFVRCSISKNYFNVEKNSFVFNDYQLVNHLVSGEQHLLHAIS